MPPILAKKDSRSHLYGQPSFDKFYAGVFMLATLVVLLVVTYIYSLVGYKDAVEPYMENIRLFGTIEYFLLIFLSLTDIKIKSLLKITIITLFFVILLVKMTYNYVDVDILGLTKDGYKYLDFGLKYSELSYPDFIRSIFSQSFYADDLGYFSIVYFFYQIYPDKFFVVYGIILLNFAFLYISSSYFYKLCKQLCGSEGASKLIVTLWCASPYLMLIICNGMKEVFFTSIIIIAVYNIYQFKATKNLFNLAGAFGFATLCLFFRSAVFYMLIVMFIIILTMTHKNKKLYFIIIILALTTFQVAIPFIIEKVIGVSLDIIIKTATWRIEKTSAGQASYAGYLPFLAAVLGPFPVFDRSAIYSIEFSQAVFVKDVLGLSFFLGIYDKIKRLDIVYLPLLIYILFNIVMMIMAGVTLDLRYHMTYLPFFFLIAVPYLKKKYIWDWGFIAFVLIIIYFYGTRKVVYL